MSFKYRVKIYHSDSRTIAKISVPDLNLELVGEQLSQINEVGIRKIVQDAILLRLQELVAAGFYIEEPNQFEQPDESDDGPFDYWMLVPVDYQLKRGFFSRLLPILGSAATILSALGSLLISIAAMEVSMSDIKDKPFNQATSIITSAIAIFLNLVIFFYSNARSGLAGIGAKLDKSLSRQKTLGSESDAPVRCDALTTKLALQRLGLSGIVVTNIVTNDLVLKQEFEGLKSAAREVDSIVPELAFDISIYLVLIFGSVSAVCFIGSYVAGLANDIEKRMRSDAIKTKNAAEPTLGLEVLPDEPVPSPGDRRLAPASIV